MTIQFHGVVGLHNLLRFVGKIAITKENAIATFAQIFPVRCRQTILRQRNAYFIAGTRPSRTFDHQPAAKRSIGLGKRLGLSLAIGPHGTREHPRLRCHLLFQVDANAHR